MTERYYGMDWDCFELFAVTQHITMPIRQKQFTVNTDLLKRTLKSVLPKKPSLNQLMLIDKPTLSLQPYDGQVKKAQPRPIKEEELDYVPIRPLPSPTENQSAVARQYERVMRVLDDFDDKVNEIYVEKVKPVAKRFCPYTYIMQFKRKVPDLG